MPRIAAENYLELINRLVRHRVRRGDQDFDDLRQDAAVGLVRAAYGYAGALSDFPRYAGVVAERALLDGLRRRDTGGRLKEHLRDVEDARPSGTDSFELAALHRAMASLPPDLRELLSLRFGLGGRTATQVSAIAKAVGLPMTRVRARVQSAIGLLRRSLTKASD